MRSIVEDEGEGEKVPPKRTALSRRGRPESKPLYLVDEIGKRATLGDRGKIRWPANLP
jgi:hypothetical protein